MEITLEAITSLAGIFIGGGGGAFFTWRWMSRKAKAEAQIEEVNMAKAVQDTYQEILEDKQKEVEDNHRLINELRTDRDHYKKGYVEMRNEVEKLSKDFYDFKRDTENERQKMKSDIARNTRIAESSRPFMCGLAPDCAKCVPVIISDEGTVKPKGKRGAKHDIKPNNED